MEELISNISQAFKLLDKVEDLNNVIHDQQSNVDSKLSDLYHYIENNKLSAAECCRIVKEIKHLREERRDINNAWEILRIINGNTGKLQNKGNRSILFSEIKRMEKNLNNSNYKNRVYKEEEIINIIRGNNEEKNYKDMSSLTYNNIIDPDNSNITFSETKQDNESTD